MILLLCHWDWHWFPIAHCAKHIRVLPLICSKLTMAAEWFVDCVVPKFGWTSPPGTLHVVGWGSKNTQEWNESVLR
jgi:hypothetical protein